MPRLDLDFYARPAVEVARDLLGRDLVRRDSESVLRGRIVETEAYTGETDPGSHAFRGLTNRTAVMFGPPGRLYVYFTYGMHYCMNVVTDTDGIAGAVLLRALEPLEGIDLMRERRNKGSVVDLCNGPAKLCQAFGIDRTHNGENLFEGDIWIEPGDPTGLTIATTTRVGLSAGADLPLRFFVADSPYISPGRPSKAASQ